MGSQSRDELLAKARLLEGRGDYEAASRIYLKSGEPMRAARALAVRGRYEQAGRILLASLDAQQGTVDLLDGDGRKRASLAASYLARAGDTATAVDLLVALGDCRGAADLLDTAGDHEAAELLRSERSGLRRASLADALKHRQAQELERAGKLQDAAEIYLEIRVHAEAARLFKRLGRTLDAAKAFATARMPFKAALCYVEIGDLTNAQENLVWVPKTDPQYRAAAMLGIRTASEMGSLSFQLEHFLQEFLQAAPAEPRELESLYLLSKLYEKSDLLENAKEVLRNILDSVPRYRDALERLQRLEEQTQLGNDFKPRSPQDAARRKKQRIDSAFSGLLELPPLPEMPEMPILPDLEDGAVVAVQTPAAERASVPMEDIDSLHESAEPDDLTVTAGPNMATGSPSSSSDGPSAMPGDREGRSLSTTATGLYDGDRESPPGRPSPVEPSRAKKFEPCQGAIVNERYRIDAEIGRGGMATVFRATDLMLDEEIALKVFSMPEGDPKMLSETLARWKQELKLCRKLQHPNVVRLYDIGVYQDVRYISMELLEGKSLGDILTASLIPMDPGLDCLIQVCAGLQVAHDNGVIHRDIKPDNLFVTKEGRVKVMDFGIAKGRNASHHTTEGLMYGTPRYISPEQIRGFSDVTPAADQYSLGVVAYRMFTGIVPFRHKEQLPVLMMHLQEPPRPPRELSPEIPDLLERVILRMLEKEPDKRFSSCREVAQELAQIRKFLGGKGKPQGA